MGGHEGVNDGTEGHRFPFTPLCAIQRCSQRALQLILRSIICCALHHLLRAHAEKPPLHTLLFNKKKIYMWIYMANLFCCSYLSVWECGNPLWFVGIRRHSDVADGWLNHNKWCNSITRAFKRAKTRLFFLLQVPSVPCTQSGTTARRRPFSTATWRCMWATNSIVALSVKP